LLGLNSLHRKLNKTSGVTAAKKKKFIFQEYFKLCMLTRIFDTFPHANLMVLLDNIPLGSYGGGLHFEIPAQIPWLQLNKIKWFTNCRLEM
jgi:hypothetical protein